ncbi:hypothetical protein [uncultured Thiodictyon sp.]|uniref:hypothetical protein n=1 Tax=uncultured Thiodictyon sp. TaxID=1846217 RepID=UPI0025F6B301|nr:hypothetical protein [uncultured Thiodictyon sp.]
MDWFEHITGFTEDAYGETRRRLKVEGDQLINRKTGRRHAMGWLEVVSLAALRTRIGPLPAAAAPASLGTVCGDIRQLHLEPEQQGALIQVASQFNLLEMVGPSVSPEDGVTRYSNDPTQGPACAIAAGAGTIYRNYLVPVKGTTGQTTQRQINTLADLGTALGHDENPLWEWRNGYALGTDGGLARIAARLAVADEAERQRLRGLLRIGLHWDVEVTDAPTAPGPQVTQAYCSAMPVAYGKPPASAWKPIAQLVLEAAYEATLLAGVLNARRGVSNRVLLTRLGGGAFGNDPHWISAAIERALALVGGCELEIFAVKK